MACVCWKRGHDRNSFLQNGSRRLFSPLRCCFFVANHVQPIGEETGECGYCHNEQSKRWVLCCVPMCSYYIQNISIHPEVYESRSRPSPSVIGFMLCGWRRCSSVMYQTITPPTGCYPRTCVLDTGSFESTKSQRRVAFRCFLDP